MDRQVVDMISPDFLISCAKLKGVSYLYDVNNDGIIDMKDVDILSIQKVDLNKRISDKPVFLKVNNL